MNPADQTEQVVARLRKKGFTVVVDTMAPRPWAFHPIGVLLHHTASTEGLGLSYERADVSNLQHGPVDWPPPHVQWYVGQSGRIWLLTRGGANHAGAGSGLTSEGIPTDMGNAYLWGIEGQDDGYDRDWPPAMWEAYHALAGEILRAMDAPVSHVWRHKDYSSAGKVDTRYPLDVHRQAIKEYLGGDVEMDAQDREFVKTVVENKVDQALADAIPKIARETAQQVLSADLAPKNDEQEGTVRRALRRLLQGGGDTTP